MELPTDGKDCQTPVGCINIRTESFISLASPLDLQRAFSEPGFVDQLAVEVQTLDAVECAERFVCLLRETLLTLPKKSRRQRSQKIPFRVMNGLTLNVNV